MIIRPSLTSDTAAIAELYTHYVLHETATFETEPPDAAEMSRRREAVVHRGLPYLVADVDGAVAGYAYAAPYRPRGAYRFTLEHSIYVHPEFTRRGIGHALMIPLIAECGRQGYRQMIAVIGGSENQASIHFHQGLGFQHAGRLSSVGFKFGRWLDSVLMQRELTPFTAP